MNESAAGIAAGIGVSKLKLDVCVVDGTKGDAKFKYKVVKNTRSGHTELIAWLPQRRLPADVPVVLEATGPYSEAAAMDQDQRRVYREALLTVSALRRSMEHAVRSDPDAVWKHSAYRHYMRKYNDVVRHIQQQVAIPAPIDLYDIDKVPTSGNTVMAAQKEYFESVHANLSILEAWLSGKVDRPAEKSEDLRHFLEASLRKAIFDPPQMEREVQNAIEQLLIGRGMAKGVDYNRETGRVKVSIKECIPDFILPRLSLALEVKLAKTETKAKAIVDEINADIQAYGRAYDRLLFVVLTSARSATPSSSREGSKGRMAPKSLSSSTSRPNA